MNDEFFIAWFPIENPTEIKYIKFELNGNKTDENEKKNENEKTQNFINLIASYFNEGKQINNDNVINIRLSDVIIIPDSLKKKDKEGQYINYILDDTIPLNGDRAKRLKKRIKSKKDDNYVIIIGENTIEKYMYSTIRFCWGKGYCSSDRLSVFENDVKKIDTIINSISYNTHQDNSSTISSNNNNNNNNFTNIGMLGGKRKKNNHKLTKKINTKNYKKSKKNRR